MQSYLEIKSLQVSLVTGVHTERGNLDTDRGKMAHTDGDRDGGDASLSKECPRLPGKRETL